MASNPNAPHFVLAAVQRIYPELPDLIETGDWSEIRPSLDDYIGKLEANPNEYLVSTQLFSLLAEHERVRQRLAAEIKVQEVISQIIGSRVEEIATRLGYEPESVDGLSAAAYAKISWEFDPESVPAPEDTAPRSIKLSEGGLGGAQSVKFKNLQLDLGGFSKILAGFLTTGVDIVSKPNPLLIAAAILLTVHALHDAMKTTISEQEASVFWGMIKAMERQNDAGLDEETILSVTNEQRLDYGLEPLKAREVRLSLSRLKQIGSVEQVRDVYHVVEGYKVSNG